MNTYLYQTSEFGVSHNGIHLLRSGLEYKVIKWSQVTSIKIEKGKELHNWWIIFLIGVALLSLGCYLSLRTLDILIHKEHAERYVKMLLFLLIPCVGFYFAYTALRTGIIIKIRCASGKYEMFPLREIINEDKLHAFESLMIEKLGRKLEDASNAKF